LNSALRLSRNCFDFIFKHSRILKVTFAFRTNCFATG